jgi:hypothetical protein
MRRSRKDLEQHLLRKSVGLLAADRDHCADCGRTPLTGEQIYRYEDHALVCELCRPLRREPPVRGELVRHSEHGHAVRIAVRVAA